MSTIVHTPQFVWARAHRTAFVLALIAVALAVTAGVFVLRLVTDSPNVATTSVSTDHQPQPSDNGCRQDLPGVRGVLTAC